jgi:arylsulfatase A-like enzyme
MDSDVGKIIKKLRDLGIENNTLVMFTSDNGPHKEGGIDPDFFNSNGKVKGKKRDLFDGGIRVPMIARWPGNIIAGSKTEHISAFWDVLPTLAELVEKPIPRGIDGISFLPTLTGTSQQKEHEFLYWEFHEGSSKQAIRMGKWKAVRLAPSRPISLYDLTMDIGEENNIAKNHPEVVEKVEMILNNVRTDEERWPLKDQQDTMPF